MVTIRLKLIAIFAISTLVLVGTNSLFQGAYAQKLTKNQLIQCEHLYFNYKKFGESEFKKRYDFKPFIKECIKLYKDSKWTFNGKDKVDLYFNKIGNVKNSDTSNSNLKINITKKIKVGNERFLTSFGACTNTKGVVPTFLLSSDKEQYIGSSEKMIPANACRTFTTYLHTINPSSITIEHVSNPEYYSNLKVKRI